MYTLCISLPGIFRNFSCSSFHEIWANISVYILILIYCLWNATIKYVAIIAANLYITNYIYLTQEIRSTKTSAPPKDKKVRVEFNIFNNNASGANIAKLNFDKTRNYCTIYAAAKITKNYTKNHHIIKWFLKILNKLIHRQDRRWNAEKPSATLDP